MNVSTVVDRKGVEIAVKNVRIALTVNGQVRHLELDPRTSLLDGLREHLHLTGTRRAAITGSAVAAVANAVFNATGVRVREFPITLDKVLPGLPLVEA